MCTCTFRRAAAPARAPRTAQRRRAPALQLPSRDPHSIPSPVDGWTAHANAAPSCRSMVRIRAGSADRGSRLCVPAMPCHPPDKRASVTRPASRRATAGTQRDLRIMNLPPGASSTSRHVRHLAVPGSRLDQPGNLAHARPRVKLRVHTATAGAAPRPSSASHQTASSLLRGRRRVVCVLRNLRRTSEAADALLTRSAPLAVHPQVERRPRNDGSFKRAARLREGRQGGCA